jgi:predicted membrane protein (TIGR00267 family)
MASGLLRILRVVYEEDIARRYFVMNSFDGALTILGIIVALYLSNVTSSRIVTVSCIGAAIAMGVSGFFGAYATEHAERKREFEELERHLMTRLRGTEVERKMKVVTLVIALVDGLSPAFVSLLIVTPFILKGYGGYSIVDAYHMSIGIITLVLLGLGGFVGYIAKDNIPRNAFRMLAAGILVAVISLALEYLKLI